MGSVYVYDAEGLDTSTTGLCGELVPVSCEHEELAGGLSTITMQHPFDEWGKWQHLEVGNLLKCDVRCRTAPAIDENDLLITSVERWTVRTTLTSTQRRVFKSKKGSKKNGSLIMGREVFVLQQVTTGSLTRWQIKFEVQRKRRKKIIYTWKTGWIENKDNILDTKLEDVTTPGGDMEAVCPSVETAPQLFRINRIEKDAERGVSVTAEHVSYDLKYNVTRFNYTGQLTGLQCLKGGTATIGGQAVTVEDGIMGSLDFDTEVEAYTNIGSVRVAADYINVNPTAALLDPKTGFLAKYGAELIRDDWTMYFVTRAGRDNGMRIEYGKNLTGVQFEVSEEDLYTAVLPLGVNKNGSVLYLADNANPGSISNYVLSEHAALYPFMRVKVLECDATVEKTKKGVTLAVARARMLAEAQAQFSADNPGRIDVPEMSARVNFVELGDTVEYEKYKGLESVFLYDTVTVADAPHGIEIKAEVQETRWDVLEERMIEIVVGNVSPGNVWSWAVERVEAPEPEPVVWVSDTPPDDPTVGMLWTNSGAVSTDDTIYPVMQWAEALDWAEVDPADIAEGAGAPGRSITKPFYLDTDTGIYYRKDGETWTELAPVTAEGAPTDEDQCLVEDDGQGNVTLSVAENVEQWVQTNDIQAVIGKTTTVGKYEYYSIDEELGLLVGNLQIKYEPGTGILILPYKRGE
jgi:phage minor structural protein